MNGVEMLDSVISKFVGGGMLLAAAWLGAHYFSDPAKRFIDRILSRSGEWPIFAPLAMSRNSRILVIDDQQYSHVEMLARDGFQVDRWDKVKSERYKDLDKRYELLLLDVKGVEDDFGGKDGIDTLQNIRSHNPWIPIRLYSAFFADLDPDRIQDAETLHDGEVNKRESYGELKELLLQILPEGLSEQHVRKRLETHNVENALSVTQSLTPEIPGRGPYSFRTEPKFKQTASATDQERVKQVLTTVADKINKYSQNSLL